eukprot:TRINITY_DN44_c0_g1_i1.p1 TRINITY_DN44_c0_g1~~TRINITY_DN44_c0_g1_i1.p1  ORF type:complete len:341 (-),score=100.96 TRINITY_DN44_c0_g1_i1:239-1189(-)
MMMRSCRLLIGASATSAQASRRYSTAAVDAASKLTIGVIGAGQMGAGIAQVAAVQGGHSVLLLDSDAGRLQNALRGIDRLLEKDVGKGRLTDADRQAAIRRISATSEMADFSRAQFVIEAVSEQTALKEHLFRELGRLTPASTVLASNTSSISITRLASVAAYPQRVIGMHFMNPVPVMKLVEVIPGLATSDATLKSTLALTAQLGKTATLSKDVPGFIANRVLMPYINEAIQALYEGIGTKEDIDTTMKLGTNVPMGPLTLADFIGLDTCLAIMRVLHTEFGDSKYRPSPLLVKYCEAGWFGKKTGKGFYDYAAK